MSNAPSTEERRPPSAHARFTLVACTVVAGGLGYLEFSGQAGIGLSTWLVGMLLALHATFVWLEDTRPGFMTTTAGWRLRVLRMVGLGLAFAGTFAELAVRGAWPLAAVLALLGGVVMTFLVPALGHRVPGGGDPVEQGVRRPGVRFRDGSRVVTVAELEPGMQIVVGAGLRELSPLQVVTVVEDGGVLRVRVRVAGVASGPGLGFVKTPDAPVRVLHTRS